MPPWMIGCWISNKSVMAVLTQNSRVAKVEDASGLHSLAFWCVGPSCDRRSGPLDSMQQGNACRRALHALDLRANANRILARHHRRRLDLDPRGLLDQTNHLNQRHSRIMRAEDVAVDL